MRPVIGSNVEYDKPQYWVFERQSGLPRGYFGSQINWDAVVVGVSVACLFVGCVVVWISEAL